MDVLERLEDLAAVEDAWWRLSEAAPQRLPMLSPAWVAPYLADIRRLTDEAAPELAAAGRPPDVPEAPFLVFLARDGGRVVGVLPLIRAPRKQPKSRTRLWTPFDEHTRCGDAVLAAGLERETLLALLEAVRRREPKVTSITLHGVRAGSPTLAALSPSVPGATVLRKTDEAGSYLPAAGGYDAWNATLSDNFRRNLRKAANRLGTLPHRFERLTGDSADPARLDDFLALEATGWKGKEGTAIAQDPALVALYRDLTARLHRRGALEWHVLEIEGRIGAMHLAARCGRALVLLKIAYDESLSRLGPGNLLFDRVAKEALFGSGEFDEMNCTTDMEWHRNWQLPRSEYFEVEILPRGASSFFGSVLPTKMKAGLKKVPGLVPFVRAVKRLVGRGG